MTTTQTCDKCGGRVKLGRVEHIGTLISKRRDCPKCGHSDRVLIREEVVRIIEVTKRVRMRNTGSPPLPDKSLQSNKRKQKSC